MKFKCVYLLFYKKNIHTYTIEWIESVSIKKTKDTYQSVVLKVRDIGSIRHNSAWISTDDTAINRLLSIDDVDLPS